MDELRDLSQIFNTAAERFSQYKGKDFVLPQVFKDQVKEINSNTITYNKFSEIIETKGTQNGVLNIFLPNQWFISHLISLISIMNCCDIKRKHSKLLQKKG